MADVITRLKVESSEYDSKIQRAAKGIQHLEDATRRAGKTMAQAKKEDVEFVRALGQMQTVSSSARGKVSELTSAYTNLAIQYKNLTALEKNSPYGRAMAASIDQLRGRVQGLNADLARVQASLGSTSKMGIGAQFGKGLSSAASMLGPAAVATAGVTAAIGAGKKVIGDMIRVNKDFEQGSANLASVIGKSRDEITALTNQAKQLGATTKYTASQILELQTNLARLGFTQQEIINSTTAVQALATATGADLGEAANLAGAALRGFGLSADEMERVSSVLAVSTTKSALSFEKLATALPIVAPVAKQFGFSIEDTVTLLGKLSDAGMDASSAATATRNIFLNMANSSGKLAQALGRPIKSIDDLAPALKELKDQGIDLGEMLELTDKRSVTAFATFVEGTDTLIELRDAITDCSDAMHDMEAEQLNTLEGSITMLNSAWEGLMMTFTDGNSVLKKAVDGLTSVLNAYTSFRNKFHNGGDAAINEYEAGVTDKAKQDANQLVQAYRSGGTSDEQISQKFEAEKQELEKERDKLMAQLDTINNRAGGLLEKAKSINDVSQFFSPAAFLMNMGMDALETKTLGKEDLYKQIAELNDKIAAKDYSIGLVTTPSDGTIDETDGGGNGSTDRSKKTLQKLKAQYEEQEKAQIAALDRMSMNEADYEAQVYQIKRETLQKIANLYQEETAEKARANASISQLDIAYQGTQMRLANRAAKTTKTYEQQTGPSGYSQEGISALRSEIQGGMKGMQMGSSEYMFEAERLVDLTTFENLLKTAMANGIQIEPATLETMFEGIDNAKFGVTPSISDEDWQTIIDQINTKLAEMGKDPIKLDVDTGSITQKLEELPSKFEIIKESIDQLNTGVSAISTIGGAFEQLKGIGDDLAEAFSGEMDTWDALMSVFNSGIGIMQTVMSVMEAINTLQQLSNALSDQKVAKQAAETTAVVTGKATEETANLSEAGTAMTAAGANAAESSSAAGSAVAGIPIVGPVLAVAAIAAVLAATFAAMSKAKSAGNFATGGIIGGNSFSGDNLTANVNSGELILNKAQQGTIAGQLNGNPMGNMRLSTEISGSNIRVVLNNDNRQRGGGRDVYGVH